MQNLRDVIGFQAAQYDAQNGRVWGHDAMGRVCAFDGVGRLVYGPVAQPSHDAVGAHAQPSYDGMGQLAAAAITPWGGGGFAPAALAYGQQPALVDLAAPANVPLVQLTPQPSIAAAYNEILPFGCTELEPGEEADITASPQVAAQIVGLFVGAGAENFTILDVTYMKWSLMMSKKGGTPAEFFAQVPCPIVIKTPIVNPSGEVTISVRNDSNACAKFRANMWGRALEPCGQG